MRIGWIGGLKRSEVHLEKLASASGHRVEFHDGDVRGQGADAIRNLVGRSDLVIIQITVNSHGGVREAKKFARMHNRRSVVIPKCGKETFRRIIKEFGQ